MVHPDTIPRFLCDAMLARLARYLRAAGYDTLLADDRMPDREVVRAAQQEHRWLLTLDRLIAEHKAARGLIVLLSHGTLDQQAGVLARHIPIDWTARAFTRCLVDNAPLRPVTDAERATVPPDARRPGESLAACPDCGRVYWQGSHYRRMMTRLQRWQEELRL